ncbi:MAG: molecular chaperone TorD family protein [Haloarculaceae archaeon]
MAAATSLERADAWADLLVALSNCLREPDGPLVASVEDGELRDVLVEATAAAGLDDVETDPPPVTSVGALTESYLGLFQAMETPYAPPAESPYKPWYGNRAGLMGGPPAEEMAKRYAALDVAFPDAYPPDHVALLLEYGSILLDAGEHEEFAGHVDAHLDWVPALRLATEGGATEAPFHRWAVALLDDILAALRPQLGLEPVTDVAVRSMIGRVPDAAAPDSQ